MKFSEVVTQTLTWLQREGRVSYRALKREFELNDDFLEDLKGELIEIKELAIDKDGKMLVWVGEGRWTPDDMQHALEARNRQACGPVAPPDGLYLVRVDY